MANNETTSGQVQSTKDVIVARHELYAAMELEVLIIKLPSGENVLRFEDCTDGPPIIYAWAFRDAVQWVNDHAHLLAADVTPGV
jgi:hypothetical protein